MNWKGKKVIIVGGTSGIGAAVAGRLRGLGAEVLVLGRQTVEGLSMVHDVRDRASIPSVFETACQRLQGLDALIYAAGVMPPVAPDEFSTEKDFEMFEVNTLGAIAWLNAAAERMQGTGHGILCVIGSLSGERGRRGQPGYGASKAAIHAFAEALRNRLTGQGVVVSTIKPGPVDTPMTRHLSIKKMPLDTAAEKIVCLIPRSGEHTLTPVHRLIFFIIRHIPSAVFRRLPL